MKLFVTIYLDKLEVREVWPSPSAAFARHIDGSFAHVLQLHLLIIQLLQKKHSLRSSCVKGQH
jgi:hypothetical protein